MNIVQIIKHTAVRRLTLLIFAVILGWFGVGHQANAQTNTQCTYGSSCSLDQASSACLSFKNANLASYPVILQNCTHLPDMGRFVAHLCKSNDYCTGDNQKYGVFYYDSGCPAGTEWFESLGKCDKPCSQRNADLGGVNQPIKWADSASDQCIAECKYSIVSDLQTKNVVVTYGGQTSPAGTRYGGRWEYTGDRCPIPQSKPKDDEKPKQECTPATYGQTYCITPDNKECYSASTGRTICWGPSEQGTKTDGPTIQEHMPGQQTPSAPPNTTYNSTTTVTTNVNNNSSQTTTNNYTTNNNSPAGPSNNGEPSNDNGEPTTPYNPYPGGNNGTGNGSGNGDGNGNDNTSSGGGDCASPPVSSGDGTLAQIASQTWATRCAISERNKQQDEQAESLKNADDGLGTVDESGIFGEGSDITGHLSESLIAGGGGQCATGWNLMGKPIELPDGFWSLASWIGMLIVALAYLWAAVLLSEG